jgi:putative endonuclease
MSTTPTSCRGRRLILGNRNRRFKPHFKSQQKLSSRPERSGVEGSVVARLARPGLFSPKATFRFVISTGAKRSGEICSSYTGGQNGDHRMRKQEHHYYVYIVASRTRVLYVGMTNSIRRRVEEHRRGDSESFTQAYNCNRLVWFEHYQYVHNAIDREKQIKHWSREKKIALIERTNPSWADLSEEWRTETTDLSTPLRSGRDDNFETGEK